MALPVGGLWLWLHRQSRSSLILHKFKAEDVDIHWYHWFCFNVSPCVPTGPGVRVTSVFISLMEPSSNFLAADTHQSQEWSTLPALCTLTHGLCWSLDTAKFPRMTEDEEISWEMGSRDWLECIINCKLRHYLGLNQTITQLQMFVSMCHTLEILSDEESGQLYELFL